MSVGPYQRNTVQVYNMAKHLRVKPTFLVKCSESSVFCVYTRNVTEDFTTNISSAALMYAALQRCLTADKWVCICLVKVVGGKTMPIRNAQCICYLQDCS